jgi:alpha-maltose-1-phosphate synthase
LRIAIVSSGRFHVCDLARELHLLGHEVVFYSFLPKSQTRKWGLPNKCCRSFFFVIAAFLYLRMLVKRDRFKSMMNIAITEILDFCFSIWLEPCDLFIGMSGLAFHSALTAKKKYHATVWLERSSRHILSQKEILDATPFPEKKKKTISKWAIRREVAGYNLADKIVVPSRHVKESFLARGFVPDKILRIALTGVDLKMFPIKTRIVDKKKTVLMVGNWSLEKGCDLLVNAWHKLPVGIKLMHVGGIGDAPVPTEEGFHHFESVPQSKLAGFYARANLFVLPSRQDGFGMVITQAVACGIPVVCSDLTGGPDLKELLGNTKLISIFPAGNEVALLAAIEMALKVSEEEIEIEQRKMGKYRKILTWTEYGLRYNQEILLKVKINHF